MIKIYLKNINNSLKKFGKFQKSKIMDLKVKKLLLKVLKKEKKNLGLSEGITMFQNVPNKIVI